MSWLFGKKKQTEIVVSKTTESKTTQSIEKLKETVELLEKRQKLLQKKIDKETENAKDFIAKNNKPAAMRCLKTKKQHQAQFDKLTAQINNTETMIHSLENAVSDVETLKAQQLAASTMKDVYKATGGIEKVDEMLDDIRDTMDRANELSDILSQQLGGTTVDEDEIEDELAALEEETLDKQLDSISSDQIGNMKVPTGPIASKPKKAAVVDEFADLEAELNF